MGNCGSRNFSPDEKRQLKGATRGNPPPPAFAVVQWFCGVARVAHTQGTGGLCAPVCVCAFVRVLCVFACAWVLLRLRRVWIVACGARRVSDERHEAKLVLVVVLVMRAGVVMVVLPAQSCSRPCLSLSETLLPDSSSAQRSSTWATPNARGMARLTSRSTLTCGIWLRLGAGARR